MYYTLTVTPEVHEEFNGSLFVFRVDKHLHLLFAMKHSWSHTFIRMHTHIAFWGRDKMDAISQTTFSNAFSWMKMHGFRLRFHWSLFLRFKLTMFQHWFRQWLGAGQATSHYLNQWSLVYWHIYASPGLNELNLRKVDSNRSRLKDNMHTVHNLCLDTENLSVLIHVLQVCTETTTILQN